MGGRVAVFAVAGVIEYQRAVGVRRGGRVAAQQPHPLLVELLMVPGVDSDRNHCGRCTLAVLAANDRLGVGPGRSGLVAVVGQQTLQAVPQAAALRQACKQRVELLGVVLQRARVPVSKGCGRSSTDWLLAADRIMNKTAGAYTSHDKLPLT